MPLKNLSEGARSILLFSLLISLIFIGEIVLNSDFSLKSGVFKASIFSTIKVSFLNLISKSSTNPFTRFLINKSFGEDK